MPRRVTRDWVLRRRLATQRLSGSELQTGSDAVRLLVCVQAQDAPLTAHSLAMRTRSSTYDAVLDEQRAGGWVRTHILRPTWHFVAPEDLRWIQALTGPKVESSLAARHRGLGLDTRRLSRASEALSNLLAGGNALTRKEIQQHFARNGLPASGEQIGHQLLVAEVRSVICSGPPRGTEHTYQLVEDVVAHDKELDPDEAARRLAQRFYAGHGPASERDLQRWSGLTLTQIRAAIADLGQRLAAVECEGETLHFDPSVSARTTRAQDAYLLSTFDEAQLTYPATGFVRRGPDADRTGQVSEAGGGVVIAGLDDVGTFKRKVAPKRVIVSVTADVRLSSQERTAVHDAAERLAAFHQRELELHWS